MPRRKFSMMLLLMCVLGFTAMSGAQPRCDPITQYEKEGQCCKMCGPGTRMPSSHSCLDPQCTPCADNEYQDRYTTEIKCQLQPYCDPNLNFEVVVSKSKEKRSPCMCKEGFHCSSETCFTCFPHKRCGPGHGARPKGNHTHDTVCQQCAEGTFSAESSWDGPCRAWTRCSVAETIKFYSTDVSDFICEPRKRSHVVLICVVVFSLVALLLLVVLGYFLRKGDAKKKMKDCCESPCLGVKTEPPRETEELMPNPADRTEEEAATPELLSTQEEGCVMSGVPEENEDELSQEMSGEAVLTENGNLVTQENGKTSILSRQESQPKTFTD